MEPTDGAIFVCLAGVFKEFLPHLAMGAIGLPSLTIGISLYTWSIRRAGEWVPTFRLAFLIALGVVIAFTLLQVHIGLPGLLQRIFISLILLWLVIVARGSVRASRSEATRSY